MNKNTVWLILAAYSFVSVIIVIAFAAFMFSNSDGFMLSQQSSCVVFKDGKGAEHTNAYDRDKANESYRAGKE